MKLADAKPFQMVRRTDMGPPLGPWWWDDLGILCDVEGRVRFSQVRRDDFMTDSWEPVETPESRLQVLERENAELRARLEVVK